MFPVSGLLQSRFNRYKNVAEREGVLCVFFEFLVVKGNNVRGAGTIEEETVQPFDLIVRNENYADFSRCLKNSNLGGNFPGKFEKRVSLRNILRSEKAEGHLFR